MNRVTERNTVRRAKKTLMIQMSRTMKRSPKNPVQKTRTVKTRTIKTTDRALQMIRLPIQEAKPEQP
jgi:hypothetical protein